MAEQFIHTVLQLNDIAYDIADLRRYGFSFEEAFSMKAPPSGFTPEEREYLKRLARYQWRNR